VSADFLEALRQVELPGNVRQLENIVRHALARRESDDPLDLRDLPVGLLQQLSTSAPSAQPPPQVESGEFGRSDIMNYIVRLLEVNEWNLERSLETCERHAMEAAMLRAAGNQSKQPVSWVSRRAACITNCINIGSISAKFRPEICKEFYRRIATAVSITRLGTVLQRLPRVTRNASGNNSR
jgi:transcriptional regulator with AAA-type ATPase domain